MSIYSGSYFTSSFTVKLYLIFNFFCYLPYAIFFIWLKPIENSLLFGFFFWLNCNKDTFYTTFLVTVIRSLEVTASIQLIIKSVNVSVNIYVIVPFWVDKVYDVFNKNGEKMWAISLYLCCHCCLYKYLC